MVITPFPEGKVRKMGYIHDKFVYFAPISSTPRYFVLNNYFIWSYDHIKHNASFRNHSPKMHKIRRYTMIKYWNLYIFFVELQII